MSVRIKSVDKNSIAQRHRIEAGWILEKINVHEINDVLDYQFYLKESTLALQMLDDSGKRRYIIIRKNADDDIGLNFETYLMDSQHHCKNKCIFCFIDQLPRGMRDSLYFKDDDSRLSFLFGNYITLTNLTEHDVDRIIEMHISPVNISVHTMNPKLRVEMMKNPNAGKSLDIIYRLAEAGIKMNTQLVLCPGINDGKELEYSLEQLGKLYPQVQSIAAVPVGLTKHREGLCKLELYNKQTAGEVIDIIECFADHFQYFHKTRLAFAADEFYLKAERKIPEASYYEDFPQIENGVGLWASLRSEFYSALEGDSGELSLGGERRISLATGVAAYPLLTELSRAAEKKFSGLHIDVREIKNEFFGENITVAGLIVGQDLVKQLKGTNLGEELLIPSVMLRHERDMFLDSMTLDEVQSKLGVKMTVCDVDGYELLDKMLGR
ncbi:MAG: DUF512 domain-containing protein [Acutalibacteraceae bacterium]|nr:DUF512 domain-containing protein [Oscillospiraceae bacterium]